jgi:hypothetical protein
MRSLRYITLEMGAPQRTTITWAICLQIVAPQSKGAEGTEKVTPEIVRRTVSETRRRLSEPATKCASLLAGRNLCVLLEEENLAGADGADRVLRPYWPILWRLAARGHYYVKQEPIREKPKIVEEIFKAPIPPVTEGGYTLSFPLSNDSRVSADACRT